MLDPAVTALDPDVHYAAEVFLTRRRRPWGYFRVGRALVYVPLKCGSTSFKFALVPGLGAARDPEQRFYDCCAEHGLGPFPLDINHPRLAHLYRLLAVRDPVERFASLWREIAHGHSPSFRPLKGLSPDALLDVIAVHAHSDPHFEPQAVWAVAGTTLVRYDQLLDRLGLPAEHRRASAADTTPMPVERIRTLYAKDVELWHRVCRS